MASLGFDDDDYSTMANHLLTYQKKGLERSWNEYRQKVPEKLLNKWRLVMEKAEQNGFRNPVAIMQKDETKITWGQVLGFSTNADKCMVCLNNTRKGSCPELTDNQGYFKPCWK